VAAARRRLGRRVRLDVSALLREPWRAVRAGQLERFWLGPAAAAAVLVLSELARTASGQAFLRRWAIMHGDEPWWLTLQKVPLSLFAPAYLLPCGFAMLQVFVVFGGAQVLIGVRRTLGVAVAAHLLGSLSPRLWVWLAPPLGLPARYLHLPDAGPSVAALAVAVFLVVRLRILRDHRAGPTRAPGRRRHRRRHRPRLDPRRAPRHPRRATFRATFRRVG
jgi:hypothetical protein